MSDEAENKTSSFAVALTPEFDDDGKWSGAITAHVEEEVYDDLEQEELTQIRSVVGMMASTLTLMEHDVEFLEYVKDHFLTNYQDMIKELIDDFEQETAPNFTRSEDGNVITLNFNTKTHGNA